MECKNKRRPLPTESGRHLHVHSAAAPDEMSLVLILKTPNSIRFGFRFFAFGHWCVAILFCPAAFAFLAESIANNSITGANSFNVDYVM